MKSFFSHVKQAIEKITAQTQNNGLVIFALIKLKVSPKKWDLIACADGLPRKEKEAIRFILNELQKILTERDLALISGIIVLNKQETFIKELQQLVSAQQKTTYKNETISGLSVKELHFLQVTETNRRKEVLSDSHKDGEISERIKKMIDECVKQARLSTTLSRNKSFNFDGADRTIAKNIVNVQDSKEKKVA